MDATDQSIDIAIDSALEAGMTHKISTDEEYFSAMSIIVEGWCYADLHGINDRGFELLGCDAKRYADKRWPRLSDAVTRADFWIDIEMEPKSEVIDLSTGDLIPMGAGDYLCASVGISDVIVNDVAM